MYTRKEIQSGLARYAERELTIVKERSKEASKMRKNGASVRQIIHYMFDVEDKPPEVAHFFGNQANSVYLSNNTAIPLWPNRATTPEDINGFNYSDLRNFISEGVIFPLIQNPEVYEDIPLLASIIIDYQPPSYFWRGNMVFSILAGGDENFERIGKILVSGPLIDWSKKARTISVIKRAHLYRDSWEPHHQKKISKEPDEWEKNYLLGSFSFKYVNACTFLGQEFVDTVLEGLPPEKSLRFLTTFHILTAHPMSQALLTNATIDMASDEWDLFVQNKSDYFCYDNISQEIVSLPLSIWARPTFDTYMEMRNSGIKPLLSEYTCDLGDFYHSQLGELRASITRRADSYNEWVRKFDSHKDSFIAITTIARCLAAAVASLSGKMSLEMAIAAFLLPILADKTLAETAAKCIKQARLEHLVTRLIGKV